MVMTKTAKMVERYRSGDVAVAFGIAKTFRLGLTTSERACLARGHEVLVGRAPFYVQIGKDPDELLQSAHQTFRRHWLPTSSLPSNETAPIRAFTSEK